MARGWENKAVESMMDDHDNRPKHREPERTPEQIALDKKRYGLELSRKGVWNDLQRATNPRHREQLEAALRHLDGQLAALEGAPPDDQPGTGKGDAEQ
ncbi:MAG: hypothetical protein HYX27_01530 [Acidobacteria bacterium]|nr:hypothetical protein [Acidobacteriota bacterium]